MISCNEKYNINRKVFLANLFNSKGVNTKQLLLSNSIDEDIRSLLKKMSKKKASQKEINIIKDEYSEEDFNLIKNYIEDSNLIFETIYPDETFSIFKARLHSIFDVKEDDNIYIWFSKSNVSSNDLLELINLMFGNLDLLPKELIIKNCKNLFNVDLDSKISDKNVNKIILYNVLTKINNLTINQQIGFDYNGNNLETINIEPNPFDPSSLFLDNQFVTSSGEKKYLYKTTKYDKSLLETLTYNTKVFNLCLKSDLLEYAKKQKLDEPIIKSLNYKYFPLSTIENIDNIKKTLNSLDERINKTQMNATNNSQEYIKYLKIIIKPIYSINNVNLETIFKNIKTINLVPFIKFRSKNNNKYKVIKQSLNKIYDNQDIKTIESEDFKEWTLNKSKIIERPKESLLFKYFIKRFGSYNKFISIILNENLDINLVYNFNINERFTLNELIESFENINKFVKTIIKDYSLIYPILTDEIFDKSNILINIYNFTLNLELNLVKTFEQEEISSLINYMYPYFEKIENEKMEHLNLIKFKYKRINAYFSEKDVYKFLKKNKDKPENTIIELLIQKFLITNDQAIELYKLYNNYAEDLQQFENKFFIGTFIILNFYKNKVIFNNVNSYNEFCRIRNLVNSLYKISLSNINNISDKHSEKQVSSLESSVNLENSSVSLASSNSSTSSRSIQSNIYIPDYDDETGNVNVVEFITDEEQQEKNKEKPKTTEQKKNLYMSILEKLNEADPTLFNFKGSKEFAGYSKQCQNNRQPVILTLEEKQYIDKHFPKSYTGYLKYGSTPTLMEKNYYICPSIWCPISHVSVTQEYLEENNGKCPEGEDPMKFDFKIIDDEEVFEKRYPGYLGKGKGQKHPDNYNLPCCFKNKQKDTLETIFDDLEKENVQEKKNAENKDEEESNEKYIFNRLNVVTPTNRYSILPPIISSLLQNESNNQGGSITRDTKSFVRKGVIDINDMFLSSLIMLLDNNEIKNIKDLIKIIIEKLEPLDYLRLNNGNTLKIYYTKTRNIYMKDEFNDFKTWINNNEKYVEKLGLKHLVEYINELKQFKLDDNDDYHIIDLKKEILREYIIFNSFTNFQYYLQSDIPKNPEEMLDLFSPKFNFINQNQYNIIILNEDYESNNTFIFCSKFYDAKYEVDLLKPFVFIIKSNFIYEPLMHIELVKGSIKETKQFTLMDNNKINNIINLYRRNCNIELFKHYINPRKLEQIILALVNNKYAIKYLVITTDLKSVGFILNNNLFIPFNRYNTIYTLKYKLIYLKDIYNLKVSLDSENITENVKYLTNFYNKINHLLFSNNRHFNFYNISEIIENNNKLEAILIDIKYFESILIPINLNKNYDNEIIQDVVSLSRINEEIFINYQIKNEEKIYNQLNNEKENIINNVLLIISNIIISNPSIYQEINHIKHPLNPFSLNQKRLMIKDIIKNLAINFDKDIDFVLDEDLTNTITEEILYKDISVIIKTNLSEMKLQDNEILFDQQDIEANKITDIIKSIDNPFKTIFNSIEDSINYIDIKLNKDLKDWGDIITKNYEEILPKTPWGIMMKDYKINIAQQYNNEYLLRLFKKIASFKLHNKTTVNILKEFLNNKRAMDYIQNKQHFLDIQKNNIRFKNLFKNLSDDSWITLQSIFDNPDYYYSTYEILALAEFLNINVTIIGRSRKDGEFPNGIIHAYNNSEFYLFFHITLDYEKNKYNKIQLIMKNDKIILTKADIKDNLWRNMQNNILTEIIVNN